MKSIFKIKGMHCSSCVLTIENALNNISGVNYVSVNLALENVTIDFDDSISPDLFQSILKKSGFNLIIDAKHKNTFSMNEQDILFRKLKLTLLFGIPFRVLEVTIIKFLHIYALKRGRAVSGLNVGKPALSNKKDPDE